MPKKKTSPKRKHGYTDAQEQKLLELQISSDNRKKVNKLAERWGKSTGTVQNKWYSLHGSSSPTELSRRKVKLEIIDFINPRTHMRDLEMKPLIEDIDIAIKDGLLENKRALLIEEKHKIYIRQHLADKYPKNKFALFAYPKDVTKLQLVKVS